MGYVPGTGIFIGSLQLCKVRPFSFFSLIIKNNIKHDLTEENGLFHLTSLHTHTLIILLSPKGGDGHNFTNPQKFWVFYLRNKHHKINIKKKANQENKSLVELLHTIISPKNRPFHSHEPPSSIEEFPSNSIPHCRIYQLFISSTSYRSKSMILLGHDHARGPSLKFFTRSSTFLRSRRCCKIS